MTPTLRIGTGNRSEVVGSILTSKIKAQNQNKSSLVMKSMIAGMKLSNSVGANNYVDVQTQFDGNDVQYEVTV